MNEFSTGVVAISVILPVFNEASHIEEALRSLLNQDARNCSLEILVVDGGSVDGTREIVRRWVKAHSSIRLLDNPGRKTPMALNIGLRASAGDYVCIFGAHAKYPPDYIRVCMEELKSKHAAGCSGRLITASAGMHLSARLAAWCIAHRFTSSRSSVRTHPGGYVDTIPFPVMDKQSLLDVGGYDERLDRNQDNDMNQRLRAFGHKLYLTPRTQATYYARPGVKSLLDYAYNTGWWNGTTARLSFAAMSLRHFVPFAFVLVLLLLGCVAIYSFSVHHSPGVGLLLLGAFIAIHLLIGTWAGIETALRERSASALLMPPIILAFHLAYGAGTARSLFSTPDRSFKPRVQATK
jgi:glycosyltransferase involved in cell wall biosynthesis